MTKQTIPMKSDPPVRFVAPVTCSPGNHVCKHRGSKPGLRGRKAANRAANKMAKRSRRVNRRAN
jgi:hypothetical protein